MVTTIVSNKFSLAGSNLLWMTMKEMINKFYEHCLNWECNIEAQNLSVLKYMELQRIYQNNLGNKGSFTAMKSQVVTSWQKTPIRSTCSGVGKLDFIGLEVADFLRDDAIVAEAQVPRAGRAAAGYADVVGFNELVRRQRGCARVDDSRSGFELQACSGLLQVK